MRKLNCILLVDDDNATNMLNSFVLKKNGSFTISKSSIEWK